VEKLEAARTTFAGLVNADPDAIAVTTSVSAAVSAIANGLDFSGERRKVVITDFDFPTTAQIWHAQKERGAQIVQVKGRGNWIAPEAIDAALDEETLLVSIPHVCYRNGARLDIAGVIEAAHRKGVLVLVDSYQALGTVPIDVTALDVDFLVGGVLKYLLASAGLAYAYVRPPLIADLHPTVTGWFAQANIFAMHVDRHDPAPTARRLESGTPPVPILYAAIAGIDLIRSVGVETIAAHLHEINGALKEGIQERGFTLASPPEPDRHGAMIAVRSNNVATLVNRLAAGGILVSSRENNLRISPHLYNNLDDIDHLLDELHQNRDLL
jgi:selenocysteine lyase/cysteine desulfurase